MSGVTCQRCQTDNAPGARFCEDCGARLELTCPSCGQPITAGKRFCRSCGAELTAGPPPTGSAPWFASPDAYTPKHLAERILTSRAALEGERKQVTVLFADLKGSMELLADRDPEEARKILDPVLERMMEAVHHYEGTVNQVMGDGIMALFGAPLAHEDHAVRACYAALRMQDSVGTYADEVQRSGAMPIQIRVGLNSGEVVVRSVGSDLRMDYTAVGQTTHLAARMEQLAKAGSILIALDTMRLVEGYVQVKPLGRVNVKGVSESVEVYEVLGVAGARTRLQASAARGLSRFVGRDAEMTQLRRAFARAESGQGQVVALVGEPGVGKSRLVYEFTHSHRASGWLILESGSVSYGKATAYLPVIELLKAYFKVEGRDDARAAREKITGKLLTLDRSLEPMLPAFLALLDVSIENAQWAGLDPLQRRRSMLDAVKGLLLRESQVQPLLLVFEDLHWIDSETQALLDSLIESLPTARLLLLVNYRPEYQHGWGGKTYYGQLRLDPLPPESAGQLLHVLLGDSVDLEPLAQLLISRTEGNPFFLEESVRTLVEMKALIGERGAYTLTKPLHSLRVPATVQAILAARIDRLLPEDKHLLQTAAVIGKDVPFVLLETITELAPDELRAALTRLQAAEFVYETRLFPDLEFTFKHALTHEVAYASLLQERRRGIHARVMEAIERKYPERLVEHIERLAHHAFRGEVWDQAGRYLRQAGDKALGRSAHREAATSFEQALETVQHLPNSVENRRLGIDLRLSMRHALFPLPDRAKILDRLREAETLAGQIGDHRRLGHALTYIAAESWIRGDYSSALDAGRQALALGERLGDANIRSMALFRLGQVSRELGDFREASRLQRLNMALLGGDLRQERFGQPSPQYALSGIWLVLSLSELGEFGEGIKTGEEVFQLLTATNNLYGLVHAAWAVGELWLQKGELDRARTTLEKGRALSREQGLQLLSHANGAVLAYANAVAGQPAEGAALLETALEGAGQIGMGFVRNTWLTRLAEIRLWMGARREAAELATRALDMARSRGERANEAWALHVLGEVAARAEPTEEETAARYHREALTLAEELAMRPLVAHCHFGLGKLYRRIGQREQAREHLATARTMYREMDMWFWLAKTEAGARDLA